MEAVPFGTLTWDTPSAFVCNATRLDELANGLGRLPLFRCQTFRNMYKDTPGIPVWKLCLTHLLVFVKLPTELLAGTPFR